MSLVPRRDPPSQVWPRRKRSYLEETGRASGALATTNPAVRYGGTVAISGRPARGSAFRKIACGPPVPLEALHNRPRLSTRALCRSRNRRSEPTLVGMPRYFFNLAAIGRLHIRQRGGILLMGQF